MPAKCLLLLFFGCCLINKIYGQNNATAEHFITSRFKPFALSLSQERTNLNKSAVSSFRAFEVLDYRADTSRIGFTFDRATGHRELILQPGTGSTINAFLNKHFADSTAPKSLLIVIRKLWISEITPEETDQAFAGKPHTSRMQFRAESYLKVDAAYIPFTYIDTTITSPKKMLQIIPFRLPELLSLFMEKVNAVDAEKALKTKKRVSYAFIDSFSNKKFLYAMHRAEVLQKGVYANLEDFRNNRPTIHNYVVEQDAGTLSLNLKDEQDKSYFTRKIWGYCDGQESFVMINGNLYPVIRQKNAYYVFGSKNYVIKNTRIPLFLLVSAAGFVMGNVPVSQKVIMQFRMFTLDLETGVID